MPILVNRDTKVICQGITGKSGRFHTGQCVAYGTRVVAGVTPGKGGQVVDKIPVYETVADAVRATGAETSMIYVPAPYALSAITEAADAGVRLVVCITEGIPVRDMIKARLRVNARGARLIGPNCPGIITPDECKIGIMPGYIHKKGRIGVISRSGTLTYEAVWQITREGLGQSTCIGIGGDPVLGTGFIDCLELFAADPETDAVLLIGEIGGSQEEEAAAHIRSHFKKKTAAFIAGRTAPKGKRMGHAGAIISGSSGTADEKCRAFRACGTRVIENPGLIGKTVREMLL